MPTRRNFLKGVGAAGAGFTAASINATANAAENGKAHDAGPHKMPAEMVSNIRKFWTLEPGDIIFTGTPQGVILGYPKEKQVWLKAGDEVTSSLEKLGELKFRLA